MTTQQRISVVEEILLSDNSDDEVTIVDNEEPVSIQTSSVMTTDSSKFIRNESSESELFLAEQIPVKEVFQVYDVTDSSDNEAINEPKVNTTNKNSQCGTIDGGDLEKGNDTDDDQFYIAEEIDNSDTLKGNNLINSCNITIENVNLRTEKENCNNLLQNGDRLLEGLDNSSSDDEIDSVEDDTVNVSAPQKDTKQFRIRGKKYVRLYCTKCNFVMNKCGKICNETKSCKKCSSAMVYQCKNCRKNFQSYHKAIYHLKRQCKSDMFWRCPDCEYTVLSESKLLAHIKRVHEVVKMDECFRCDTCQRKFSGSKELKKHEDTCKKVNNLFYCDICSYKTKWKNCYVRHVNFGHVPLDDRPICVPDITSSSNITVSNEPDTKEEHERLHNLAKLHCSKCALTFDNTDGYGKKCENCQGPLQWQCGKCKELSKSYCGIYDHLKNTCATAEFFCPKCSKKFKTAEDSIKHKHLCGQFVYLQCEVCSYKTRFKNAFIKHVKVVHNMEDKAIRRWI